MTIFTYYLIERDDDMNEIVSLNKEIEFDTMINKITSISLEHTLMKDNESSIKGDLIVSGTYKQTVASSVDNPFSYKIPVEIVLDEKYDLSNVKIDIDDFTYEVVDDNKLKVNVDIILDNLEKKEEQKDELVNVEDLFLDESEDKKIEVTSEKLETLNFEEPVKDNNECDNKSLFMNLDSSNESYSTYSIYILRENDTVEDIINKYNVTREQLEEYNDLSNVKIGSKIIIPSNE